MEITSEYCVIKRCTPKLLKLNKLPDENLLYIFSFLNGLDLIRSTRGVCHKWRNLVDDEKLWETVVKKIIEEHTEIVPEMPAPTFPLQHNPPSVLSPLSFAIASSLPLALSHQFDLSSASNSSSSSSSSQGTSSLPSSPFTSAYSSPVSSPSSSPLLQRASSAPSSPSIPTLKSKEEIAKAKKHWIKEFNKRKGAELERWSKPEVKSWKWVFQTKMVIFTTIVENVEPNGIGRYVWPDGTIYEGEWKDGSPDGAGTFWKDGWKYTGELKNGKENGKGRKRWGGGTIYEGEWEDGYPHGFGVKRWITGGIYEGEWSHGREHGKGRHTWYDGSFYDGHWLHGEQHGHGLYVWETGNCFEGEWERSHQIKGVYNWLDGRQYAGEYKESKKHGKGLYLWHDGSCYEGEWEDGLRNGFGIMRWPDGSYFQGQWEKDKRSNAKDTNVVEWTKHDMPFDYYFTENMELWHVKYQPLIQERIRKVEMKVEEERTKMQIKKLRLSRENIEIVQRHKPLVVTAGEQHDKMDLEKPPTDNKEGTIKRKQHSSLMKKLAGIRYSNWKLEGNECKCEYYFDERHNHYHHHHEKLHNAHSHYPFHKEALGILTKEKLKEEAK